MAAMFLSGNTGIRCTLAEVCPSVRIIPVVDAVKVLAVSILVCLRVSMPLG